MASLILSAGLVIFKEIGPLVSLLQFILLPVFLAFDAQAGSVASVLPGYSALLVLECLDCKANHSLSFLVIKLSAFSCGLISEALCVLGLSQWSSRLPVSGFAWPPFRFLRPCSCIENGAVWSVALYPANMTRVGGRSGSRCAGAAVIPWRRILPRLAHLLSLRNPWSASPGDICRSGIGFRERIVIADARAAVGRGDPQLFHGHFIVAPFIGLPLSACSTSGARGTFGQQPGIRAAARSALSRSCTSHPDFAAEDVHNQVEVEEHARDRPGHRCPKSKPDRERGLILVGPSLRRTAGVARPR